jgi:hypothetical protein
MSNHPMQPTTDQVDQWASCGGYKTCPGWLFYILAASYAAGADAELDACVEWISRQDWTWTSSQLLVARRPKPKSLKQQALELLQPGEPRLFNSEMQDTIRRALEALPDDN